MQARFGILALGILSSLVILNSSFPTYHTIMQSLLTALRMLTILPLPGRELPSQATVARSRFWFPAVGVVLGCALAGVAVGAQLLFPATIAALLVLIAWVVITGAFHLDGLADTFDGLFGGKDRDRRLEIMRDSRVGVFGMSACVIVLLGKCVVLSELLSKASSGETAVVLVLAVFVARCNILLMAGLARYPRDEGTGRVVIEAATKVDAVGAVVLTITIAAGVAYFLKGPQLLIGVGCTLLVAGVMTYISRVRLGGVTGDCLGAVVELSELVLLLGCFARRAHDG